ncbi:MAG: PD40 domain-containing protein, partial [Chrysiogenetes bacterium]|nr:PD40 domain-containing protein [Chrysiogenetes bacterium]
MNCARHRTLLASLAVLLALLGGCIVSDLTNALRRGQLGWLGKFPKIELEEPPAPEGTLSDPVPMTVHPDAEFDLTTIDDKGLAVFVSDRSGNWDLWAQPLDGAPPQRLLDLPSRESQPVVSPDRDWVAFVSDHSDEHGDIHRVKLEPSGTLDQVNRSGRKEEEQLPRVNTIESSPQWVNDDLIAFTSKTSDGWRLFAYDWDSEKTWLLSSSEVREFALSPDEDHGSLIAYLAGGALWLARLENGRGDKPLRGVRVSPGTALEGFPAWGMRESDKGLWLYYTRWMDDTNLDGLVDAEDNPSLWRIEVDSVAAKTIGLPEPLTGGEAYDVSPAPSKHGLYFVRQRGTGVGIVRLPLAGRAAGLRADEAQVDAIQNWGSAYDRLLGYRWVRQRARTASNQSLEIRCTYEIAEEFEALDNLGQAMAAY